MRYGDIFPNDATEWADTDGDGLGDNIDIYSGCTDVTACNYNSSSTLNIDNTVCTYADGICETCSGEQDGTGLIVDNDSDVGAVDAAVVFFLWQTLTHLRILHPGVLRNARSS